MVLAACAGGGSTPDYLVLATTTSVGNSGLLDVLAPAWEKAHGVDLRPALVGSGRALRMLEQGQADVVISHAPEAEAAMLERHPGWRHRVFMYNEFALVGPPEDPAGVKAARSLEEALRRIAGSEAVFVSRADQSGTHEREQALWTLAGTSPPPARLLASGAGMGVTLRQASDQGAYTLSDGATFARMKKAVRLVIVWEGDTRLRNTYTVIVDPAGARHVAATAFADWLSTGKGREVIAGYRVAGSDIRPFLVWN